MELNVFSVVGSVALAYHPKVPTISCILLMPAGDSCGDISSGLIVVFCYHIELGLPWLARAEAWLAWDVGICSGIC